MGRVFTFDEASHEYRLDGRRIPSVTQILHAQGAIKTGYYTEEGRNRGTYVHAACQFLAEGDLDWSSVLPAYLGYVRSFEQFWTAWNRKPLMVEKPLHHPTYQYGVKPDLVFENDVVEIKTGVTKEWWWGLQTAAQAMAVWGSNWMSKGRYSLQLKKDGTAPTLTKLTDVDDGQKFLTLLSAHNIIKEAA